MARCADGFAAGGALLDATEQALARMLAGLSGRAPDLVVVHASCGDSDEAEVALRRVAESLPGATVVGALVEGTLGERVVAASAAVSIWGASLPGARLRSFHLEVMRTEHSLAVVGMPTRRGDDELALLLADPWSFPAEGFVSSSASALDDLPLVGGLVGAPYAGAARMLIDGRVVDRGAVGVVIGGEVAVRAAVAHAGRPVGPPMTVTASEGEAVLQLAGRPAVQRVESVLDELSPQDQALASCGLLIGSVFDEYAHEHGIGDFDVQSVLGSDLERCSLIVAEPIPVGTTVRLHVVDPAAARADLDAAVFGLARTDEIEGALLFSGTPSLGVIGDPEGDLEALRRSTAARGVAGMVTVGGIGPVADGNRLLGFASSLLIVAQATPDRVLSS
jgi:small ligand-binding sensory domain FIST